MLKIIKRIFFGILLLMLILTTFYKARILRDLEGSTATAGIKGGSVEK